MIDLKGGERFVLNKNTAFVEIKINHLCLWVFYYNQLAFNFLVKSSTTAHPILNQELRDTLYEKNQVLQHTLYEKSRITGHPV